MDNDERSPLLGHRPSPPSPRSTRLACAAILLTETLERIAFYGVVGNLVLFLNEDPYDWTPVDAANALFFLTGLSYMTSVFGGWLADSYLGRFKTMVLFFILYIVGYAFLPLFYPYPHNPKHAFAPKWCAGSRNQTHFTPSIAPLKDVVPWSDYTDNPGPPAICSWAVFLCLFIIGIGTGSVKANIAPFGADQVKHEGMHTMRVFFNWYYWCVNAGALIALGILAYVQQELSFFWGYVAPGISLSLALIVFIAGCKTYIRRPPGGSVITNIGKICYESCRRRAANVDDDDDNESPTPGCLDMAKIRYGGSYQDAVVNDVKKISKIFVIFVVLIPYWMVYFQMQTTYQIQGMHMRLDFDHNKTVDTTCSRKVFRIPSAWLSLFDVIFLIILIPIMDRIVYPMLDARGYHLSLNGRILIGMIFAILSICTAGALETYRLSVYWHNNEQNPHWQCIGFTLYRAANISILYQIPQYAFIGISEVFASVAGLEMAYSYAPRSMQGSIMGMYWFTQGVGSLLSTAITEWFKNTWFFSWDHGDINCRIPCKDNKTKICKECHLNYYFFFLGGIQAIGLVLFILLAWKLKLERSATQPRSNGNRATSANGEVSNGTSGLLRNPTTNGSSSDYQS